MKTLMELQKESYENNKAHGFDPDTMSVPEAIALMHSELSEALEEFRNGTPLLYYHSSKPEGLAAEYADVVIRMLSDCQARGIDLYSVIIDKMHYNATRPYKHGGKAL